MSSKLQSRQNPYQKMFSNSPNWSFQNPWKLIPLLPIPAFSSLVSAIPANFYPCIFLSLHFHPCKHQSLQIAIPAFLSLQAAIPANCYPWKNKSCIFSTLVSPNHQSQFISTFAVIMMTQKVIALNFAHKKSANVMLHDFKF